MIVGSVKYLGSCIHVQEQTHMASGTFLCYPDTHLDSGIRIYCLLLEKQQSKILVSLKWFSQAQHVSEKCSLVLMWPLAILNAGLACLLFTQQHLNMCRNARLAPKAPPLLSLSLFCHDLKTWAT